MNRLLASTSLLGVALIIALWAPDLHAQPPPFYDGPGMQGGVDLLNQNPIVNNRSFRDAVINIVNVTLTYLALFGTAVIVLGGIMLVFSMGEEGTRDKVKNMIIFLIIGVVLILLAKGIMTIFVRLAQ